MVEVAFYIANKGKLADKLMAWLQNSKHSHIEVKIGGRCYSSSQRDGGVRGKRIDTNSGKWDLIPLLSGTEDEAKGLEFFEKTKYKKYDTVGAIINLGMKLKIKIFPNRYNCVEWAISCINAILGTNYNISMSMNEFHKTIQMIRTKNGRK